MPSLKRLIQRGLSAVLAGLCGIGATHGALAADDLAAQEEIRRRQAEEAQSRQAVLEQPQVNLSPEVPPDESAPWVAEQPCFTLSTIELAGLPVEGWLKAEPFAWLQQDLQRHVGRCVGEQGLQRVVREASNALIAKGYTTTRAGLVAQDLSKGTLRLQLLVGRVREIRLAESAPIHLASAFPISSGDILNLRDIEQGLEQIRSLASQDVEIDIVPAETAGFSDLVIKARVGRRWRAGLTLDNSGSRATGLRQVSGSLSLDAPLGLNDALTLSLNQDAERDGLVRGSRGHSLSYALPWGYWVLSVSANRYRYHQRVEGSNQAFQSWGRSAGEELKLSRVIWRGQFGKTTVQGKFIRRRSQSFIDDVEIEIQRRDTTTSEWALLHRQQLGALQLDVQLSERRGRPWWGGQRDTGAHQSDTPTFNYTIHALDINANLPFKLAEQNLVWASNLRGQTSREVLYGADQFSIGGRHTVRGFDGEQTLAGERGWLWRNELSWAVLHSGHNLFTAYDVGGVGGISGGQLVGRYLAGATLGIRGAWRGLADAQSSLSYELSASRATRHPDTLTTRHPVLAFQISYQY
ncbi:hemolysin activation/secretion protein [Chitinivorax tropicus]|uniref:Hemolysin activation/secretion protein n=1 Tax=Chitinivorax tropicus TaxID=714531 RepID=A0A840MRP6_9PROT|nr:ShlB/FhaC/HecB family hemolysin secretion/activation protein [Chitinivorax tropicus]MBB5020095.1 hemolysin activation/secretion protein [Chitinivorax tropicus]